MEQGAIPARAQFRKYASHMEARHKKVKETNNQPLSMEADKTANLYLQARLRQPQKLPTSIPPSAAVIDDYDDDSDSPTSSAVAPGLPAAVDSPTSPAVAATAPVVKKRAKAYIYKKWGHSFAVIINGTKQHFGRKKECRVDVTMRNTMCADPQCELFFSGKIRKGRPHFHPCQCDSCTSL